MLIVLSVLGCGGPQSKGAAPAARTGSNAEQDCLAAANAHVEPKANAPDHISVSQILVRHAELAHPRGATRTRGQACLRALEALNKLKAGASWADVVKEYSDAPGPNAGDLGQVTKDDLEPAFAEAAFALEVDQVSYVVESSRGFHIIMRTE